jgi:arylsulfatase
MNKQVVFAVCYFLGCLSVVDARHPNIVIVFTDDQGWGDLSCYGSDDIPTPNIDQLATEGMRFTNFYVSQPVCSASRASLLTGCYANRVGIRGALGPRAQHGLDADEHTLAEVLKALDYATACFGKWHLGHRPEFLPGKQGFDEYYGIPYSNDMWPGHPETPKDYPILAWYTNAGPAEQIVDLDDQDQITRRITEQAVDFIHRQGELPFLLYIPHSMPHVPLGVGPQFRQSSIYGPYADVIKEIDWSVGQIRKALTEEGVLDDTLFLYISDNGPWLNYGDHAGTTGGLREGKGTTFEGGVRVPFIARYPALIPAGQVCHQPAMTIDILPTLVELTDGADPARKIDGRSMLPLLRGEAGARSPQEAYFFWYHDRQLQAMRMGDWKLHFPHKYRSLEGRAGGNNGRPAKYTYGIKIEQSLFHLADDPNETTNVAAQHPDIVQKMTELADEMRSQLGDTLTGVEGSEIRDRFTCSPASRAVQ